MRFLSTKEILGCTAGSLAFMGVSLATGVALPAALPAMIAQLSITAFICASAVFFSYGVSTRAIWPGLHAGWNWLKDSKLFKKNKSAPVLVVTDPAPASEAVVVQTPGLLQKGMEFVKDFRASIPSKAQDAYGWVKEKSNQALGFINDQWTKAKEVATQNWQEIKNVGFVQWAKNTGSTFAAKLNFGSKLKPAAIKSKTTVVVEELTPAPAANSNLLSSAADVPAAPQVAADAKSAPVVAEPAQPTPGAPEVTLTPAPVSAPAQESAIPAPVTVSAPAQESNASATPAPVTVSAPAQESNASAPEGASNNPAATAPLALQQEMPAAPTPALVTPPRVATAAEAPRVRSKKELRDEGVTKEHRRATRKPRVAELRGDEGSASDYSASDREDSHHRRTRARSPMPSASLSRHAPSHAPASPRPDELTGLLDQPVPPTYAPLAQASSSATQMQQPSPSEQVAHQHRRHAKK